MQAQLEQEFRTAGPNVNKALVETVQCRVRLQQQRCAIFVGKRNNIHIQYQVAPCTRRHYCFRVFVKSPSVETVVMETLFSASKIEVGLK